MGTEINKRLSPNGHNTSSEKTQRLQRLTQPKGLGNSIKEIIFEPGVSQISKAGKSLSDRRSKLNKGTRHGGTG